MGLEMLYLELYSSGHYLLQRHSAGSLSTFDLRYDILPEKKKKQKKRR